MEISDFDSIVLSIYQKGCNFEEVKAVLQAEADISPKLEKIRFRLGINKNIWKNSVAATVSDLPFAHLKVQIARQKLGWSPVRDYS